MKKILILLFVGFLAGCSTDHFEELNTDKKNPSVIPAEPLFTNAVRNFADRMQSCNVNENVYRLYAQYWAQTTYPDESQYNMVARNIPDGLWREMYRDVLRDLQESKKLLEAAATPPDAASLAAKANKLAIIDVMEVLAYSVLVDNFGDVPYTEALNDAIFLPKYDDARTIYDDLVVRLQDDITTLNGGGGSFSGSEDPIYGGDVALWDKFANSLLLKLGMRYADVDAAKAQAIVGSVGEVITTNAENFAIKYYDSDPNTNPLWRSLVQSGRNDFVPANTLVDMLNGLNDPRLAIWMTPTDTTAYIGGVYGTANAYSSYAHLSSVMTNPSLDGVLMSASEVEFLLAEAAARGFGVSGTAEEHYNDAVTLSIMEWGGTEAMAADYLAQADIAYGAGDWKTQIGTQKWLAMFNNGFEGWNTWRIFDLGFFNVPDGLSAGDIPTRLIYPISEATLNGGSLSAAAGKMGGDSASGKIFWDVN